MRGGSEVVLSFPDGSRDNDVLLPSFGLGNQLSGGEES